MLYILSILHELFYFLHRGLHPSGAWRPHIPAARGNISLRVFFTVLYDDDFVQQVAVLEERGRHTGDLCGYSIVPRIQARASTRITLLLFNTYI